MTCYYPKPAWIERDKAGNPIPNANGRKSLKFSSRNQLDFDYELPCGKCDGCRAQQARDWGVRMYHESLVHKQNCMITLTYDDDHLPDDGKLSRHDVQKWLKRIRHKTKLRYVIAGEYGDKTRRPHYHAAIFGRDWLDGASQLTDSMYTHVELVESWGHGFVSVVPLEPASCMYVAGYVNKKIGDRDTFAMHSRRPPIGKPWTERYIGLLGNRQTVTIGGQESPIPRKYFEWYPLELDQLAGSKKPKSRSIPELRNREINHKAKTNLLRKEKI